MEYDTGRRSLLAYSDRADDARRQHWTEPCRKHVRHELSTHIEIALLNCCITESCCHRFPDPRFGRLQEGFSEDPWLTGRMGIAAVSGLQGNQTDVQAYLGDQSKVNFIATSV